MSVQENIRTEALKWAHRYVLTTGKLKVAPEATVDGIVELPHWKSTEVVLQLGFVSAAFAVHVTWMVSV
jgi:hypothetical protein